MLLQLLAKHRVQSAQEEKRDDYSYEDQVTHTHKYQRDLIRGLIKPCAKCVKKSLTRLEMGEHFDLGGLRKHIQRCDRIDRELRLQVFQIASKSRGVARNVN